jgi:formylglycine-generating enzyme required for sulfatase activity
MSWDWYGNGRMMYMRKRSNIGLLVRGGCWGSRPSTARAANRGRSILGGLDATVGFRVVKEVCEPPLRASRGGSWDRSNFFSRAEHVFKYAADLWDNWIGFRVVREVCEPPLRASRGGSWRIDLDIDDMSAADRDLDFPDNHYDTVGFRVVKEHSEPPMRALRGGSWHYFPAYARATGRIRGSLDLRVTTVGFRLVKEKERGE